MKAVVACESIYGNTHVVADAIGRGPGSSTVPGHAGSIRALQAAMAFSSRATISSWACSS
jgi:hypothetical protein